MKKLLFSILLISLFACEKEKIETTNSPLVKCGTLHINSDGGQFRYKLTGSLISTEININSDTTFDIYENKIYRIYYKGTTIQSIDSVWFNPGGNWPGDIIFDHIDTVYDYHVVDHQTTTGSQSFNDILPSTIYDR